MFEIDLCSVLKITTQNLLQIFLSKSLPSRLISCFYNLHHSMKSRKQVKNDVSSQDIGGDIRHHSNHNVINRI